MGHVHTGREDSKWNTGQNRTGGCHGHMTGCAPRGQGRGRKPLQTEKGLLCLQSSGGAEKGPSYLDPDHGKLVPKREEEGKATAPNVGRQL